MIFTLPTHINQVKLEILPSIHGVRFTQYTAYPMDYNTFRWKTYNDYRLDAEEFLINLRDAMGLPFNEDWE